jgi:hypothetical protein
VNIIAKSMARAKKNVMDFAKLKPYLHNLFVDGNIILKLVLKNNDCSLWIAFNWLRIRTIP